MGSEGNNSAPLTAVSGVQLAQGLGVQPARGFWADAWSQVLKRKAAVAALAWLGMVLFFAVYAPFIANGHPLWATRIEGGVAVSSGSPLLNNLSAIDIILALTGAGGLVYIAAFRRSLGTGRCLATVLLFLVAAGASVLVSGVMADWLNAGTAPDWAKGVRRDGWFPYAVGAAGSAVVLPLVLLLPVLGKVSRRVWPAGVAAVVAALVAGFVWVQPLERFDYVQREAAGELRAVYTIIPFSPGQRYSELNRVAPGTTLGKGLGLAPEAAPSDRRFHLGTDAFGGDVLSAMLHACRLSISIGLVSTGIAVFIGITLGAVAGFFGGWIDVLVQRLIEVFMAVPVLFLLIVAAGVLPPELRNVYVTMAIIGLVTWTGAARFTRAEFYKLRNQDFVQSAKAMGLPLRSVLFRHMLPNGVTPVLVDASFLIASAILAEATLSYLGLGPVDSASWGKLLSSAVSSEGEFKWWLAIFPGFAIFLTVLAYNLLGEALRDAIDPKLKKARV